MKLTITFSTLIITLVMASCTPLEYDCHIGKIEYDDKIPQEGTVIDIPVDYTLAATRFQPGQSYQLFRYRALLDGVEYSYAHAWVSSSTPVVVPVNDSHEERTVTIDVSLSTDYDKEKWGEWQTVFTGTQAALDRGKPLLMPDIDSRKIQILFDGMVMCIDLADNASVRCLKYILLDHDLQLDMSIADNGIFTNGCKGTDAILEHVPLNHTSFTSIIRGNIYLNDFGSLTIYNETQKRGIQGRETYIGRISKSSLEILGIICNSRNYDLQNTYSMYLHLE